MYTKVASIYRVWTIYNIITGFDDVIKSYDVFAAVSLQNAKMEGKS